MNKAILMGRLTRDPEIRYTLGDNPMCIARYTLAVDRRFNRNNDDGNNADFIPCVCFGKSAEFVEKYLLKGTKMAVTGRIQTGSYTNRDGVKVYTTEVVIEEQEFAESKNAQSAGSGSTSGNTGADRREAVSTSNNQQASAKSDDPMDGFMNIPDGIDDELPFA